jgi:signal transduction histidine kinase
MSPQTPAAERARLAILLAAGAIGLLLVVVTIGSLPWLGRTFPGFLVMQNRVVPSIALPHWADGQASRLFQHQVLAIDGRPVEEAREVYDAAEAAGPDRALAYRLRGPLGDVVERTVKTRTFEASDYTYLFGAYLLNGVLFCAIGLLVLWLGKGSPASWGLVSATFSTGVFVATATDLYGPFRLFRLHVAAEAAMAAGFVHLALVFPTDRLKRKRRRVLTWIYGAMVAAIALYEAVLWNPSAYTFVHLGVVGAQVIGCGAMMTTIVLDFFRTKSPLVRRRVGVVALGVVAGMLVPILSWTTSAVLGGGVSMNWAALTAFFFPVSLAYAVLQADLFEIDVVVRRATVYVVVVALSVASYVVLLALVGSFSVAGLADRPTLLIACNVALLLVLGTVRGRVQTVVDRLFFRVTYDAQAVVARLGGALENALYVREVVDATVRVVHDTFFPQRCLVLAVASDGRLAPPRGVDGGVATTLPSTFVERLRAGQLLTRYEWEDGSGRDVPEAWRVLDAELLVPVRHHGSLEHVLALGGKESGRSYNVHDSTLLMTVAGQVSLAMATARAFESLADLNASLEDQVADRTAQLADANRELSTYVAQLQEAYRRLEQSQKSLLRADRLATLGRLAAGIAHEINTPLAALMNGLEVLSRLGTEYDESIDDVRVTSYDHHEIASEIRRTVESAQSWAQRAAGYVARIKSQGHEPQEHEVRRFTLGEAIEDVAALLDHRLRATGCRLDVDADTQAILLSGDIGQLVQLLVNVVDNAIWAYEELDERDGRIEIRARRDGDVVTLTVRDYATGIPPQVAARIFEELFTTKERGKGTGLGLWIARNIAEQSFGGSLDLMPVVGRGACLCAKLRATPSAAPEKSAGVQASA